MKPEIGDHVKLFLKNSIQVEGIVHSWGKTIVLSSENDKTFMVIKKVKNINMYKITPKVNEVILPSVEPVIQNEDNYSYQEIPNDITPVDNYQESSDKKISNIVEGDLKIKELAELYVLKKEEEKKSIAQKLKQHHITNIAKVKYELPGFFKK